MESSTSADVVSISCLGQRGRFGNQFFQYAFARTYAEQHGLRLETPEWVGQTLYGFNDPPISRALPSVVDDYDLFASPLASPPRNVDLEGYFQFHTSYYRPFEPQIRAWFVPQPKVLPGVEAAWQQVQARGKTVVGIHLRRGDYGREAFFLAPTEWYLRWLSQIWDRLDKPVLYLATDQQDTVCEFARYSPVVAADVTRLGENVEFFVDYHILTQCHLLAISNSTFSFAASMLNPRRSGFLRPVLSAKRLLPFDPWDSRPLLAEDRVESFLATPGVAARLHPSRCVILVVSSGRIAAPCEMQLEKLASQGFTIWRRPEEVSTGRAWAHLARRGLDAGYEELMWIDPELDFTAEDVAALRRHDLPLACGVYPLASGGKSVEPFPEVERLEFGARGGLVEVVQAGIGFLHVRREALAAIVREESSVEACFLPIVNQPGGYVSSECALGHRARRAGFRLFADTTLALKRWKPHAFGWNDLARSDEI